jgi:putative ABC transport system permease protein
MKLPPRWADRFLEWYCKPELLDDLQGDLHERFHTRLKSRGALYARILFIIEVLSFFRPYTLRRSSRRNHQTLILPSLRFSIRYLTRQKFFTTLHIIGLTLGTGVAIVILLFIRYELSFDTWTSKADKTYRINSTLKESNNEFNLYATPRPLAGVVRTNVPGVEHVAMVFPQFRSTVAITGEKVFGQEHIAIAEPAFLDIFEIEIVRGDKQALHRPYQALISQSTAKKFFGDQDAIGNVFRYRGKFDIKVAGVFRDLPGNTSLPVSVLISYVDDTDFLRNGDTWFFGGTEWTTLYAMTFIVSDPRANPATIQSALDVIADEHINSGKKDSDPKCSLSMQSLAEIHLDSARFGGGPWVRAIDSKWLFIFAGIGVAVLFLACANFVNLSTAQAIVRSREAGIRKTIGAGRYQLIIQFLTEPVLLIFVSGALAIVVAFSITGQINLAFNKHIEFSTLTSPASMLVIFGSLVFTGLAAGVYPAWLISRVNPVASLKVEANGKGSVTISWLRKTLVIFQFAISATLMTVVFVIARQAEFLYSTDLGFRKDAILSINIPDRARMQSFLANVKMIPGVAEASLSRTAPLSNDHWWNTMGKTGAVEESTACVIYGDEHFFKLYDLQLLSGRVPTSPDRDGEVHQVVVNEKLLRVLDLGSPGQAIGRRFSWAGTAEVVGVVADFHSEPLHYGIVPAMIVQDPEVYSHASILLEDMENKAAFDKIESVWKKEFPSEPYEPRIVSDEIKSYYKSESTGYIIFMIFAGVAVLISCLGLLGLCVFATVRRTKEISIRKVLGASVDSILVLLSGQFMKVIAIACLAALPIAWFTIDFVLGFYAYHIDLTWDLLVLPMVSLILIAFITTLTQTIRAAVGDPVKNLRNE